MNRVDGALAAFVLAAIGVSVLLASSCGTGGNSDATPTPQTTDPRVGWVTVEPLSSDQGGIWKRCDGRTLMYVQDGGQSGGMSVVPSSPECAR